jgi:hypothetical protein
MSEIPIWEISLTVYGSITVDKKLRFSELKGFLSNDPFYSDIEISRNTTSAGVKATVTAYAPTGQLAHEAAILFFGQMLDALAIQINQPLYLNFSHRQSSSIASHTTLRRVRKELAGGHRGLERRQGKLYSALSFFVMIAPTTVNLQKFIHNAPA